MNIQSLSIVVPSGCPNKCKFCVSSMRKDDYINRFFIKNNDAENDYLSRLSFAREQGCHSVVLTGTGEPLMNIDFIIDIFGRLNKSMKMPFRQIELQTSGVDIGVGNNAYNTSQSIVFLKKMVGITGLSLSLADLFNEDKNAEYMGIAKERRYVLEDLCNEVTESFITLRLSLNLTDSFTGVDPQEIFNKAKSLGASQVTLRELYQSPGNNTEQDRWIEKHRLDFKTMFTIFKYIKTNGIPIRILPFGATQYSVNNISVVVDDNCMGNNHVTKDLKYAILRPDCRLYSQWNDKGSLIF